MLRYLSLLSFALLLAACGPSGTEVESGEAQAETEAAAEATYAVDAQASTVTWEGTKLIGGGHTGTIPVSTGTLETMGDELVGGKFTLDVAGLENTDLGEEDGKGKLETHLKGGDFFDVEKYPTASFVITNATPVSDAQDGHNYDITGNLTLKGTSRSITIPANVTMSDGRITASTPDFVIDRTEWGMQYGSGGIEGIAQDNIINDEVGLNISLVAMQ
jgi:polyisoprenoid-binding protein YceI